MKSAEGMKYMLATQCSNPHATKAEIGGRIERILSAVLRALKHIHTAMHTKALQKMARKIH